MTKMEKIQKISLQEIDLSDETFSVNFMPNLQRLRASIDEVGLIQPVLLRKKQDGYQIVSGFRRISILEDLGCPDSLARIIDEKELGDLQLFSSSLHENLTTRGFNAVEMAIALEKLIQQFRVGPGVIVKKYLPLFNLESDEKILKTYLSLAQMEEGIKGYVLREEVSRTHIRRLATYSSEDRLALFALFSPLKSGENRLREMFSLLDEISKRDRLPVREIVDRPEIQAILLHKELTASQRTERVKKILMDLRYPRMHAMEETFENKKRDLNLPPRVSLSHSPFFEGKGLRIEFQFETLDEYRSILSSLDGFVNKREFLEMIQDI
jgi:ParB family chromosome partitioning protein